MFRSPSTLNFSLACCCLLTPLLPCASAVAPTESGPIKLEVDATQAARKILHARLEIPVTPGPLTLVYPKWIPGDHSPSGPVADLVGLKMSAGGQPVPWRRDPVDMYALLVDVPPGNEKLVVALDYLSPDDSASASATAQLVDLSWSDVLLYPKGPKASEIQFAPSVRLPAGWHFGTALDSARQEGELAEFQRVSLETLVDSPLIAGAHFRTVALAAGTQPPHFLHIVADSAAALELKADDQRHLTQLTAETGALFGARHYRSYHFLLTLSDHVAHFGLEHHESSDNRVAEKYLADADALKVKAYLLPHEMTHSWNGKYRRPTGLATPDYQGPMRGELLWVYEGLTDYLGLVLAARCGLWTAEDFCQKVALDAAAMDYQPGRTWRPLSDTAVAAQLLYGARAEGRAWRRSVEFYPEGGLLWLEADVVIRQQTAGQRSLDDFCKRFCGGASGPPRVVPYTTKEVYAALQEVAPYDWPGFFQSRVYQTTPHPPLGGITGGGWRLTYTNKVPDLLKNYESAMKYADLRYSIGLIVREGGVVQDVVPGSPADRAEISGGMQVVAVNGRRWSNELLRSAVGQSITNTAPLELLVENDDYFKTCKIDYHSGERYPRLERDAAKPDVLTTIVKSLTVK